MKQYKKWVPIIGLTAILGACNVIPRGHVERQNPPATKQDAPIADGQLVVEQQHNNYYQPLIDDQGHYPPSKNRGLTLTLNSDINLNLFETDLLRLSTQHFSTDQYFIQEGQLLIEETVSNWLGRESDENPSGLNPPEGEGTSPLYLASILEHDFYTHNGEAFELGGLTIGLAMNGSYETDEGVQEIPQGEMIEQAQQIAGAIVARIRESDKIGSVPIVIGVYEQADSNDLSGGTYILEGLNQVESDEIEWTSLDEERLLFPLEGGSTDEGNMFRNFQEDVETVFPSLNGVYARAHYMDETLASLTIHVTTKFYGRGEVIALTQYLETAARNHLPDHARIQIEVESLNGLESFLSREMGEEHFNSHVLY